MDRQNKFLQEHKFMQELNSLEETQQAYQYVKENDVSCLKNVSIDTSNLGFKTKINIVFFQLNESYKENFILLDIGKSCRIYGFQNTNNLIINPDCISNIEKNYVFFNNFELREDKKASVNFLMATNNRLLSEYLNILIEYIYDVINDNKINIGEEIFIEVYKKNFFEKMFAICVKFVLPKNSPILKYNIINNYGYTERNIVGITSVFNMFVENKNIFNIINLNILEFEADNINFFKNTLDENKKYNILCSLLDNKDKFYFSQSCFIDPKEVDNVLHPTKLIKKLTLTVDSMGGYNFRKYQKISLSKNWIKNQKTSILFESEKELISYLKKMRNCLLEITGGVDATLVVAKIVDKKTEKGFWASCFCYNEAKYDLEDFCHKPKKY